MYRKIKRTADIILVLSAMPAAMLLVVVISLLIRVCSGSGVFFVQERAGLMGRPFRLYKFRTMKSQCDPYGNSPQDGSDPRLTSIGKYLRLLSLDELPQLLNVLRGEMSLVGPRPLYVSQIAEWNERQRRRLEVMPGLTGLAQISGRGALTIEEKLELDVFYVEHCSLWFDLRLLLATFFKVLVPVGIYEKRYSEKESVRGISSESKDCQ
ncbi:MAG: sugar transferase [Sedimentisphaerales bacterium]|nr:sugar transferase [Sedimentisphaerales bacterium]